MVLGDLGNPPFHEPPSPPLGERGQGRGGAYLRAVHGSNARRLLRASSPRPSPPVEEREKAAGALYETAAMLGPPLRLRGRGDRGEVAQLLEKVLGLQAGGAVPGGYHIGGGASRLVSCRGQAANSFQRSSCRSPLAARRSWATRACVAPARLRTTRPLRCSRRSAVCPRAFGSAS